MNNYLFDVKLFTSLRINATSEAEARKILAGVLDQASINCGALPDGSPLIGEVSLDDDEADLVEVNGEYYTGEEEDEE